MKKITTGDTQSITEENLKTLCASVASVVKYCLFYRHKNKHFIGFIRHRLPIYSGETVRST